MAVQNSQEANDTLIGGFFYIVSWFIINIKKSIVNILVLFRNAVEFEGGLD